MVVAVQAAVLLAMAPFYGPHRDELYFVVGGPAAGVGLSGPAVVHAVPRPRLATEVAPHHLVVLRLWAILAVVGTVLLAAQYSRLLGGGRAAQVLTAVCVAAGAVVMTLGHHLSTATIDTLAWPAVLVLATQALADRRPAAVARRGSRRGGRAQQQARRGDPAARHLRGAGAGPGCPSGPAHPVAVAGRADRRRDVDPQPGLAGPARLAGVRPLGRHRRGVRRPRRPAGHARRGVLDLQPLHRRPLGHRPGPAVPPRRLAHGAPARVRLPGRHRGLPGDRRQGLLLRRRHRAPHRRRLDLAGRSAGRPEAWCWPVPASRPRRWWSGRPWSRCCRPRRSPTRSTPRSTTTRPRRSAGRSTPPRSATWYAACPTAPSSSPPTTARPAPSSGTTSARRSTAATTAGATGDHPRTAPGRSWSSATATRPIDFTGCQRAATLHNDVGIDNEERGQGRLGLRRPDRLVVRALARALPLRRLSAAHRPD